MYDKIYPQCYNGTMIPMITADGFLQPCCQVGSNYNKYEKLIDGTNVENRFIDPDFSLYNKSFSEIIESKKWDNMINGLADSKLQICHMCCGSKNYPKNSALYEHNFKTTWTDKKVKTKHLKDIQLETTNRCTLECPYCSRFFYKKRNKNINWLNRHDLDLNIIKDVITYKNWRSVLDCGSYGDPIYYKYYHEMLELLNISMIRIYRVSIAATGRSEEWWDTTQELWKQLHESGIQVNIFWGIDGLEDTSSKHRINQDWNEISKQMKKSARNGLYSIWQYIPMSFNEHQIDEAKKLAADWGVNFYLKQSYRFSKDDPNRLKNKNIPETEMINNMKRELWWNG